MSDSRQLMICSAIALSAVALGYGAGLLSRPWQSPAPFDPQASFRKKEPGPDSEPVESDNENGELASVKPDDNDQIKLALVVRTDLGMSTGKIAAQASHATLACYKSLAAANPTLLRLWERTGQTKVVLASPNENELLLLQAKAQSLSLCARTIRDAGRTQIAAGSITVLGVGPAPARLVNQVTGKLRLL